MNPVSEFEELWARYCSCSPIRRLGDEPEGQVKNIIGELAAIRDLASTTVPKLREWAREGDPDASYQLGRAYHVGLGVKGDKEAAERWHLRAAELGHPRAMVSLAISLPKEEAPRAAQLLQSAAEAGDSRAIRLIGLAFQKGDGVPRDRAMAAEWFARGWRAGDSHALYYLGCLHAEEPAEHQKAVECLRGAVEAGVVDAWRTLAPLYADLTSPAFDPQQAALCGNEVAALRAQMAQRRAAKSGTAIAPVNTQRTRRRRRAKGEALDNELGLELD